VQLIGYREAGRGVRRKRGQGAHLNTIFSSQVGCVVCHMTDVCRHSPASMSRANGCVVRSEPFRFSAWRTEERGQTSAIEENDRGQAFACQSTALENGELALCLPDQTTDFTSMSGRIADHTASQRNSDHTQFSSTVSQV